MQKNIAVIGGGYWGKNLIRNFNELNALFTFFDIDKSRLDFLRKEYPDLILYDNLNSLLREPKIEAVAISTPSATHYSIAKEALLANKDVFVEKPIALRYSEGEELVSLASEKKKILMVGHVLIYHPAVIKLKQLIDRGELGKINYIYSNRLNFGKIRTEENILWSFAPHDISVILHLLNELPDSVSANGGNYLHKDISDVTISNLNFQSGVKSHTFVSWLHPYKDQRFVIIGDKKMALFNDVNPKEKLFIYEHKIDWIARSPIPHPEQAKVIEIEDKEPLRSECEHFINCIQKRTPPLTDGNEGLRVLKILEACQKSLEGGGKIVNIAKQTEKEKKFFVHETSRIDDACEIGEGSKIWHFSHILKNCQIGKGCNIGQNVSIGPNVTIGNNVKIQNNVSVYEGVNLEDDVFCGPSMVFTNVINPRSHWPRKNEYQKTLVKKGASLGANSTVICGITIGKYAFVGAGAMVNRDVPDYGLVYGNPARLKGWMCYCGIKLNLTNSADTQEVAECPNCGRKYKKEGRIVSEIPK